jgi:hypothetical protein
MESLEAARHRTWSQRSPSSCWPADTFDVLCPKVLQIEEIANELSRTLGDYDRVRLCNALQASRDVRRLTDDAALLRLARSDQIADDNQAGGNTHAGLQWRSSSQRVSPPQLKIATQSCRAIFAAKNLHVLQLGHNEIHKFRKRIRKERWRQNEPVGGA